MVVMVTESPGDDNSKNREKCRKRRERKRQAKNKARVGLEMHDNLEASDKTRDCKVANDKSEMIILEVDLTVQPLLGKPKTDAGSTETLSEVKAKTKKKKKKRKKKATVQDETQSLAHTNANAKLGSTENPVEGNVTEEKTMEAAVEDEDQIMGQKNIDVFPKENPTEGNVIVKRKMKNPKKATVEDEVQAVGQTNANASAKNKAQIGLDNLEASDKMSDCKVADNNSENIILETDLTVQPLGENLKTNAGSTETLSKGKAEGKAKKKRTKKKAAVEYETQNVGQTNADTEVGSTENPVEGNMSEEKTKREAVEDEDQNMGQTNMDVGYTENPTEGNVTVKRKKKKPKTATVEDEMQAVSQTSADVGDKNKSWIGLVLHDNSEASDKTSDCKVVNDNSENIILETDLTVQPLGANPRTNAGSTETVSEGKAKKKKKKTKKKATVEYETHSMGQTNADAQVGSTEKPVEGKLTEEKTKKAAVEDEDQSMGQTNVDMGSTENPTEGNVTVKRKRKKTKMATVENEGQAVGQTNAGAGSTENLMEGNVIGKRNKNKKAVAEDEVQSTGQINTDAGPTENPVEGNATRKRKKKKKKKKNKKEIDDVSLSDVKDVGFLSLVNGPIISTRRKLLVLDLNGLVADIIMPPPKHCRGDTRISGREIFKRPFYDNFLQFCFESFDVGIWSSRSKIIVRRVVDYLLGDLKSKLLFCWDMSHSTQTGVKTLENRHKPLVCKELRKIWETEYPNLGWNKGDYNESNTLLLDDSPYKALLNPMHTAIFPNSYSFMDKNEDNSLGPGGDLRVYLEGLLASENVQKYVEQHPFGQEAITEKNLSWGFYSKVLNQVTNDRENKTPVKPC